MFIEIPHGISTTFVFSQDLGHELTFGEVGMIRFYVLEGDVDPEPQGLVHLQFHDGLRAPEDALKLRRRVH